VWLLNEGQPQAISIKVGESDGIHTEVLQGELEPGMRLITESIQGAK
jgi:HlyD family secretion protein